MIAQGLDVKTRQVSFRSFTHRLEGKKVGSFIKRDLEKVGAIGRWVNTEPITVERLDLVRKLQGGDTAGPQFDQRRLILIQGARLALGGLAIGTLAALGLTRMMSSLLYSIGASDPLTFAAVATLLLAVALLACYIPARRAMRVDPIIALRYE